MDILAKHSEVVPPDSLIETRSEEKTTFFYYSIMIINRIIIDFSV